MKLETSHIIIGVAVATLVVALFLYFSNSSSQKKQPHQLPHQPQLQHQPQQLPQQPQQQSERVMVLFSIEGCGHCKNFEPVWDEFAQNFDGYNGVRIVKVNGAEHPELCKLHNVSGFPTVKMCMNGIENQTTVTYEGDRTVDTLVEFLQQYA